MSLHPLYPLIPHRPPFLFVDEIVAWDEKSLKATYWVDPQAPFFQGHYPGNPIMPGVLISEALFQTAAAFLAKTQTPGSGISAANKTPILAKIEEAKFKHRVGPGDRLTLEVFFEEAMQHFFFMRGKATQQEGKLVLSVRFALALADNPAP
jgi:3-hydroxyacyl-[acyl-carrier-protein] dehydratase